VDLNGEGRARVAAVTGGPQPESVRVQAGSLGLHALIWGRAVDPIALLLHGNGAHAHWWDALVPALLPGWRLVALDLRGHGESDWAEPPRYRLEDFAADVGAVARVLAPAGCVLVGHSMGGRVAAWYAAEHPEGVRGLAILDSRFGGVRARPASAWRASVAGKRHGRTYATRAAALAAFRFVPDEPDVSAAVIANLAHHAVTARAANAWTFRFDRAVLALDGDGGGDMLRRLGRIRCPTLVLAGRTSWVMNARERTRVAGAVPGCAVRVFAGGHHFLLAHPAETGAALRAFLDGLDAPLAR
jgi:pimeloyl-ACP methyl ester carboxylesterase